MKRTDLAEFLGIMIGDGNIYQKYGKNSIVITGHSEEDAPYLHAYITPLIFSLFSMSVSVWRHKNKNAIALAFHSREIIQLLVSHGLNTGPKKMHIPPMIYTNKKLIARFLRGVVDTDFGMLFKKNKRPTHSYPLISATFSNYRFVLHLQDLFKRLELPSSIYQTSRVIDGKTFIQYQIDIYGKENLDRYLKLIGFRNEKHLTKVEIWKRFGYYTPRTPIRERYRLLQKPYKW